MNDRNQMRARAAHYRKLAGQMADQRIIDVLEELAAEYGQAAQGLRESAAAPEHSRKRGPGLHEG